MFSSEQPVFKGLKDWRTENQNNKMQPFRYFTHSTSEDYMKIIQKNGVLKPISTPEKWKAPFALPNAPKGSWFSMTLYNDSLPTLSPYGKWRVRKEAVEMIREIASNPYDDHSNHQSPRLFLERVVFHRSGMMGKEKRTARLILVNRGDDKTIKWCGKECDTELDLFNNPFMKIFVDGNNVYGPNTLITLETHKNVKGVPDTWVVLLVPYDVNIAECKWDDFKKTIPGN